MDRNDIFLDSLTQIESGGQSRIYLCRMNSTNDTTPIKVVGKEVNDNNQELISKELRIRDLNHENVIQVHGYVSSPKSLIVLEYLECGDLDNFINNNYSDLKINILQKIKGIIDGIDHIHHNDILHLDLHPRNILVTKSIKNGFVFKICDFGLSEKYKPNVNFSDVLGRPGYVSPEKVRSEEMSTSTDIWALGCILWKIFTKSEAFDFEEALAIYFQIGKCMHPDIPNNWPVQVQKLLFYCWDCRHETHELLKLFNISTRNKKTDLQLKKEMPLEYEWRYIQIDGSRIVPPIIWDCLDKNERFSSYQISSKELKQFIKQFGKHICLRKLKLITSCADLMTYLNESGYFKNLRELNEKVIGLADMQSKLSNGVNRNLWIPFARTLGMPDRYINEIQNEKPSVIVHEILEFWSETDTEYLFCLSGLEGICNNIHLDFD